MFKRQPYQHLLYSSGWVLSQDGWPQQGRRWHWRSHRLGAYHLWVRRAAPVASSKRDRVHVMLLGRPLDPHLNSASRVRITDDLLEALVEGRFLDQLDRLSGRFVVFVEQGDGPHVYQDAAGARAVFYRAGRAASHSALAARHPDDLDDEITSLWERIGRTSGGVKYLPGIRAPHAGVRMLTPNTSLHAPTSTVTRFWPRTPRRESHDLDGLASEVARQLEDTAVRAAATWSLNMSLTAGVDSRLTLAACRQVVDRMSFFSYLNPTNPNPVHEIDLSVAEDMAAKLELEHTIYPMGDVIKDHDYEDFVRVWKSNLGIRRGIPTLMKSYVDRWPDAALHLRSNVAEVGRVFYKGPRLKRITTASITERWNRQLADDPECLAHFDEFRQVTSFTDAAMLGYDPLDLFYWEHRMGSWHSWLCLEADVAHDTLPIYANRQLLDTMLAAPLDARADAEVFHRAIDRLWPALSDWPINPKQFAPGS